MSTMVSLSSGMGSAAGTAEHARIVAAGSGAGLWRRWGPYLSERQWGTVREDYSAHGSAWEFFPHDHARSRAYRWGEDGLAGFSDDRQRLCLGLALWNDRDPILKERLFGLTNGEGNHGEDVKEVYQYLDATPTHSYLKFLYKQPQGRFPYDWLVSENGQRGKEAPEFELADTGVFDEGRYFDVVVEYAKMDSDDILMVVTVHNRGPDAAPLRVLPQLWFRNTWAWGRDERRPEMREVAQGVIEAAHHDLGAMFLHVDEGAETLFCENETNPRLWTGELDAGFFKDGVNDFVVRGDERAVNPEKRGTKAAAHFRLVVPPGGSKRVRVRLSAERQSEPFKDFDRVVERRRREADEFYGSLQRGMASEDERIVQRQAWAGLIWSKQFFNYDVPQWLEGDPGQPAPPRERRKGRNHEWAHLNNADIVLMPDKWEYPWYAAWDLAFHCVAMAPIDACFAKDQLVLMTREWYMHPNGQLPAYEWALGDVNPPVHAWATWRVFEIDREQRGDEGDLAFLERVFHKLMLNFTWWVNRKDASGRNIFQGGFLGLDNIGVFDRSAPLPTGGHINQADGTSWMAMYSLNLMRIALELAQWNPVYEDIATKFFEHFLHIAEAMTNMAEKGVGLWCEEDEFFYDVLSLPDGAWTPLKLRTMVGLIPLFAVETLGHDLLERVPGFRERLEWFLDYRPDLAALVSRWTTPGEGDTRLLSLLRGHRMKCLLRRMLDETEFLSKHGVRALSRAHKDAPYEFRWGGQSFRVEYQSSESTSGLFGGNSNWRGPVWMPVNYLLYESLLKFHEYYGDDFVVECPTDSGQFMNLAQVADELRRRLCSLFVKDEDGRRAGAAAGSAWGETHFADLVPFFEYFDGDTGRGVGAAHQTGWTALVANLLAVRAAGDGAKRATVAAGRASKGDTAVEIGAGA